MSARTPSYRLHKPSGQAVVTLNGKDFYLGKHGTPESRAEYDRFLAEWLAAGRQLTPVRPDGLGAVVNSSRAVTFPFKPEDAGWEAAVEAAARTAAGELLTGASVPHSPTGRGETDSHGR